MVATKQMSIEEYETRSFVDGRYELIFGELRRMPDAGFEHGTVGVNISGELRAFVRPRGLGKVAGADTSFVLSRELKLIRIPDVSFVSTQRLPALDRRANVYDGPPDLAVEIFSPWDRVADVEDKVREWLAYGTRLVWVVWPQSRTVTVYTPDGATRTLGDTDELDGGEVVPGFRIAVAELFE